MGRITVIDFELSAIINPTKLTCMGRITKLKMLLQSKEGAIIEVKGGTSLGNNGITELRYAVVTKKRLSAIRRRLLRMGW